jgi:hypothetical protein
VRGARRTVQGSDHPRAREWRNWQPSCLPVNQLLTPLGIPLTGPLSALYVGGPGGPREPPLTRGGERRTLDNETLCLLCSGNPWSTTVALIDR